jgi:hypothetical protein
MTASANAGVTVRWQRHPPWRLPDAAREPKPSELPLPALAARSTSLGVGGRELSRAPSRAPSRLAERSVGRVASGPSIMPRRQKLTPGSPPRSHLRTSLRDVQTTPSGCSGARDACDRSMESVAPAHDPARCSATAVDHTLPYSVTFPVSTRPTLTDTAARSRASPTMLAPTSKRVSTRAKQRTSYSPISRPPFARGQVTLAGRRAGRALARTRMSRPPAPSSWKCLQRAVVQAGQQAPARQAPPPKESSRAARPDERFATRKDSPVSVVEGGAGPGEGETFRLGGGIQQAPGSQSR